MKKNRLIHVTKEHLKSPELDWRDLNQLSMLSQTLENLGYDLNQITYSLNTVKQLQKEASESYGKLNESEVKELVYRQRLTLENLYGSLGIPYSSSQTSLESYISLSNMSSKVCLENYESSNVDLHKQHLENLDAISKEFNQAKTKGFLSIFKTIPKFFKSLFKSKPKTYQDLSVHKKYLEDCLRVFERVNNIPEILTQNKKEQLLNLTTEESSTYIVLDGIQDFNHVIHNFNLMVENFKYISPLEEYLTWDLDYGSTIKKPDSRFDMENYYTMGQDIKFSSKHISLPTPKHLKSYYLYSITDKHIVYVSKDKKITLNPDSIFVESYSIRNKNLKTFNKAITLNDSNDLINVTKKLLMFIDSLQELLTSITDKVRKDVYQYSGLAEPLYEQLYGGDRLNYGEKSVLQFLEEMTDLQYGIFNYYFLFRTGAAIDLSFRLQEIADIVE